MKRNFDIPEWATNRIAYQVFVDRFSRSVSATSCNSERRSYREWGQMPNWHKNEKGEFHNNDFFGGNLKGIEERLEYLKSLSVGIIYLSPINESLYRYDRYATTNYMEIDPDVGSWRDLEELHEKANQMGMYIILDIAFNHCSSDNPIFQDALKNPNSQYRNWFKFDENGNYEYWYNLFKDMPVFNQENTDFQEYVYGDNGIIAKYSQYVDGFRLDLAESLSIQLLEGIRNRANLDRKRLILGEFWNKVPSHILGRGIDCPTNYLFTNAILKYVVNGECDYLVWQIEDIINSYPQSTIDTMFNSLDTHDIVRALTILSGKYIRTGYECIWKIDEYPSPWHVNGNFLTEEFRRFEFENDVLSTEEYELATKRLRIATILQYFLPGIPCIYYGTEAGVYGFKDPFNRKCFPWENEDSSLIEFYRNIGEFRSIYNGNNSSFEIICSNENVFVFRRTNEINTVFVAINRGEETQEIDVPKSEWKYVFELNANVEKGYLLPYGGIIILK